MMESLSESAWIYSQGTGSEWRRVHAVRARAALAALKRIRAEYAKRAPAPLRAKGWLAGLDYVLKASGPERERLLGDPTLDYWLFLWDKHFRLPCDEDTWRLHVGLFQGLAAALAYERGYVLELDAVLDPDGHFHLYGLPLRLELGPEAALKPVKVRVGKRRVELDGLPVRELTRSPEVRPGLRVETCGLLTTQGVVMHGLGAPDAAQMKRFVSVLRTAFEHVAERDPGLLAEMTDLVRVLVPLVNPKDHGSVSSSYVNMRGTICLSHAEDPLLQAETLIHEFCHQKMNQLLLADALLLPGQGGQVFYSPWRPDARRLRGLILGAHAFLNVARYLMKSLAREKYALKEEIAVMCNVARRLYEVEQAVRGAIDHGDFTEFGRRFMLGMARETATLFHAAQRFPPALMDEARAACAAHRAEHALPLTHFHKAAEYKPTIKTLAFGAPPAPLLYKGKKGKRG